MNRLNWLWQRLRALAGRGGVKRDIDAELQFHLEQRVQDNLAAGMLPEEASREARLRFGNPQSIREDCREAKGACWGETAWQDVRFGWRMLRKHPGFTAIALLTLALGIGANTAIFSVVNAALLQPLAYPEARQLVYLMETGSSGKPNGCISGGAFKDWHTHSTKFAQMAIYSNTRRNLTGMGVPERVSGMQVSGEYLATLGVTPLLGRDFSASEMAPGGDNQAVMLSHAFWQSHFGADPAVMGRRIILDQLSYTVIGVLPPRALLQDDTQFLVPEVIDAPGTYWGRSGHWRQAIGRLRPGVTIQEAQLELRAIKQRLAKEYPAWKDKWSVAVTPLQEEIVGRTRPMFLLLLGAVALVLLIACANVSNLLLARGNARAGEMAIRAALGAHAWRIARQMLAESLLLAVAGCALGLLFAAGGIRLLERLLAGQLPQMMHPRLDLPVLLFSIVAAAGCGLIFGVLPAWRAAQTDVGQALKASDRGAVSRAKHRSQSLLVVAEFALTLVLLVGAGLFLRSFFHLTEVKLGFVPQRTLAFDLSFPQAKYAKPEDCLRFTKDLLGRLQALPGVEAAGAISALPLSDGDLGESLGRPGKPEPAEAYTVGVSCVSGDYFPAVGGTLLRGRLLTEADNVPNAPPVLIIDSTVAKDLFPNEDPLGQRVKLLGKECEVIGIATPVRHWNLESNPRPRVYGAQAVFPNKISMVLRSKLAPEPLIAAARKTVNEADPEQPIANLRTLEQAVSQSLAPRRATLTLLGLFAVVAAGLACVGIYGVMACAIGQRARELSIRSALGAQRGDLMRLVFQGGLKPSLAGMGAGLLSALALARLLESQLFEVKAYDPLVLVGAMVMLGLAAVLAIYVPARRAARANPMAALKCE